MSAELYGFELLPEPAACRALFVDFINRYSESRDTLEVWHNYVTEGVESKLAAR